MKTIFNVVLFFLITLPSFSQLKVVSNGNVGVGVSSPTYKLDVSGKTRFSMYSTATWDDIIIDWNNQFGAPELYCPSTNFNIGRSTSKVNYIFANVISATHVWQSSDRNLKEDIANLNGTLTKLKQVNGKTYKFKNKNEGNCQPKRKRKDIGFIAQELKEIFPELVIEPDSANPNYLINYTGMVPVLVEAIKEQQLQIELLTSQVQNCCKEKSKNKSATTLDDNTVNNIENANGTTEGMLYQNSPNPFNTETIIRYSLPSTVNEAVLYIYNMQGVQKDKIDLDERANGKITIQGAKYDAGMYLYTLIANGKEVDTKRMILTR